MISIIVAVYNAEQTLERCVDSLLASTYKDLEILLVDDGSQDRSGEIADRYAASYPQVRVFHKSNGGTSSARNLGIEQARGSYIGFADNDDFVSPIMMEKLHEGTLRFPDAAVVACRFVKVSEGEALFANRERLLSAPFAEVPWQCFSTRQALAAYLLANPFSVSVWDKIFKKELFDQIRFDTTRYYEDKLASYQLLAASNQIAFLNQGLYYYVVGRHSKARTAGNIQKKDFMAISHQVTYQIASRFPDSEMMRLCRFRTAKDSYDIARSLFRKKDADSVFLRTLIKDMKKAAPAFLCPLRGAAASITDKCVYLFLCLFGRIH